MNEKEFEFYLKQIAPSQIEFRSEAAKRGERMSPQWMPDDIGTESFDKGGTAHLRKIK
ncbi:MAG: hypothetical protein IIW81_03305 [Oscillospiraceae bacterium]|nr:hypothetical protein [Oscillospiraceae bacterium]MBQ5897474.1 hypothetical protein [Oscillospiraceae bacterium]